MEFPVSRPHPGHISGPYVGFLNEVSIMTAVSTFCVVTRLIQRLPMGISWDDWCILGALVFAFGFVTTTFLAATIAHAGYHIAGYTTSEIETYLKISLANRIVYSASVSLSKMSVLFFYHRIFCIDRRQRLQLRIAFGLVLGHFLACLVGLLLSMNPFRDQLESPIPPTGMNNKDFWCAMAVFNVLLDIAILAMPQSRLWQLQMSRRTKALVSLVLLLGGIVIMASVIRLVYLVMADFNDLTYTFTAPNIWMNVELNISIICACLPVNYTLFVRRSPPYRSSQSAVGTRLTERSAKGEETDAESAILGTA